MAAATTRIIVVGIGIAVMLFGIISGNVAGSQMWDEMQCTEAAKHGLFSNVQIVAPVSLAGPRANAITNFRRLHPRDAKVKKLRYGQLLTVIGIALAIAGMFI